MEERRGCCLDCLWTVTTTEGVTHHDLNTAIIAHHDETGHTVEVEPVGTEEAAGWAEEWPP